MEKREEELRWRERSMKRKDPKMGPVNLADVPAEKRIPSKSPSPVHSSVSAQTNPNSQVHRKPKPVSSAQHSPVTQMIIEEKERQNVLMDLDLDSIPSLHCFVDFTKPDSLRNRPLVVESRTLYVCDYYLSIWSPIFRDMFSGESKSSKEIILPGKRYHHVMEFLDCIYPQQKDINGTKSCTDNWLIAALLQHLQKSCNTWISNLEQNLNLILPLAFEYQVDGLLRRCMEYIRGASMKLMDKLLLSDNYNLTPLLNYCLKQLRITAQVDFHSKHYEALSDRTKVRLLEKLQNCRSDYAPDVHEKIPEIDNTEPDPIHFAKFTQKSELYYGILRIKNGRYFYCNPSYVAAWSRMILEQVTHMNQTEINTNLSEEEAVSFLLASHPPLLKLADFNVSSILKAACKLESPGMVRKCSEFMLIQSKLSDLYDIFALFDRCYLHELLEPCLRRVKDLRQSLKFASHPTYDCLSTRAKACVLDRIAVLMASEPEISSHTCDKCKRRCGCQNIKWVCAHCGTYHSGDKSDTAGSGRPFHFN